MKLEIRGARLVPRLIPSAALCVLLLYSPTAAAEVMYMVGSISGTINGKAVEFDLHIKLDLATGEEMATVGRMDAEMGAILRQVTAIVTVGGPTGGATPQGGQNLFALSGGNFVNSASVFWPRTKDVLELVHEVSYSGGDTMTVKATINGMVPIIKDSDAVTFKDFSEIMYWGGPDDNDAEMSQAATTGVGFRGDFTKAKYRSYQVGAATTEEEAKGSTTVYKGSRPSGAILRSARDIKISYDSTQRTMSVHLFNTLMPVEAPPH